MERPEGLADHALRRRASCPERSALQLGAGLAKVKNTTNAQRGHFAVANVEPKRKIVEFRVPEAEMIPVGATITADQVREIAKQKMVDLNANDIEAAMKIIAGSARSMGVAVEGM